MKFKTPTLTLAIAAIGIAAAPKAEAVIAAYVHIFKNDTADTRFHLGEVEAFAGGAVPNGLGGATFGGMATSTNDVGNGLLGTFGDGNVYPVLGTTTALEHGGANKNPNNVLESAGAVWSTQNGLAGGAQYTLDLGGSFDVTTVRLWPRADGCCGARFQNLEIQLLDATGTPIAGTLNLWQTGGPPANNPAEFAYAPVPEPSGVALIGLAASALLIRRRK